MVFRDAVQHYLHGGRTEPAGLAMAAALDELGELLDTAVPFPPQCADHVRLEGAGTGRTQVGVDRVGQARVAADDRVLPSGDAEREQVRLAGQQAGVPVIGRGGRDQP